ncbi:MAG: hypothetical protein L0Y80_06305 [Ignavibacteriae bacterium]|nr:hypothetical protein [Ignavibacteriota bacterium]
MNYHIICVCGEKVSVMADNDEAAVKALIPTMDKHVAAKEHPEVPKNLTHEQKDGMVRSTMQKGYLSYTRRIK